MKLYESITPIDNHQPLTLMESRGKVFSFEGLIDHLIDHWVQGIEEIHNPLIVYWIEYDLGLIQLAKKIKEVLSYPLPLEERFMMFIQLDNTVSSDIVNQLKNKIQWWQQLKEEEHLKIKGDLSLKNNHVVQALHYYEKAYEYSISGKVLHNIGLCYVQLQQYKQAENAFREAIQLEVSYDLLLSLLRVLRIRGKVNEGLSLYFKYTDDYRIPFFYEELGLLYAQKSNYSKALHLLYKAYEQTMDKRILTKIIKISLESKDRELIESSITMMEFIDEEFYLLLQAEFMLWQGEQEKAILILEESSVKLTKCYHIYKKLVELYFEKEQIIKAIQFINCFDPESLQKDNSILFLMAKIARKAQHNYEYSKRIQALIDRWKEKYRTAYWFSSSEV